MLLPSEISKRAASQDLQARFEEGKPADPTKNMSPEDKKKWEDMNEKHRDKFKGAAEVLPFEEAMFSKGEDVALEDLPKELQENVKNPPPEVKDLKEDMQEESMMEKHDEAFMLPVETSLRLPAEVTKRSEPSHQLMFAAEKTAASGLYGFTKATQNDVEATIRKAQRKAASIARHVFAKDESVASFMMVHAKRGSSSSARVLFSAMKDLGPDTASKLASIEKEEGASGLSGTGLYGFASKTARLGLIACTELRASIGEISADLHQRRQASYEQITGFLQEHSKKARCGYSRMILGCYPEEIQNGKTASGPARPLEDDLLLFAKDLGEASEATFRLKGRIFGLESHNTGGSEVVSPRTITSFERTVGEAFHRLVDLKADFQGLVNSLVRQNLISSHPRYAAIERVENPEDIARDLGAVVPGPVTEDKNNPMPKGEFTQQENSEFQTSIGKQASDYDFEDLKGTLYRTFTYAARAQMSKVSTSLMKQTLERWMRKHQVGLEGDRLTALAEDLYYNAIQVYAEVDSDKVDKVMMTQYGGHITFRGASDHSALPPLENEGGEGKEAGDLSKLPPALREQAEKKIEEGKKNENEDKKAGMSVRPVLQELAQETGAIAGDWSPDGDVSVIYPALNFRHDFEGARKVMRELGRLWFGVELEKDKGNWWVVVRSEPSRLASDLAC